MALPTRIGDHPIHPMLIPFPIGLWIFSFVCDVIYLAGWGGTIWSDMAFYTMVGGLVGALAAAIFGYGDYRTLSEPRTVRIAKTHMVLNLVIVALFAIDAILRLGVPDGHLGPMLLSAVALVLLGVSGWLGGDLVYVHRVGVKDAAGGQAGTTGKTTAA